MIPPGWSFGYQNTNGRKHNSHYFFSNEMEITTMPLFEYLAQALKPIKFVNLEKLISENLETCLECANKFYFQDDGHWTEEAHSLLRDYFQEQFQQMENLN